MILLNIYASSLVLLLSLYNIKYLYLVILSIITHITLYSTPVISSLEASSLIMKSKVINIHALFGALLGFNNPYIIY